MSKPQAIKECVAFRDDYSYEDLKLLITEELE